MKSPQDIVPLTAVAEALNVQTLHSLLDLFATHDLLYEVAIQLLQYASVTDGYRTGGRTIPI